MFYGAIQEIKVICFFWDMVYSGYALYAMDTYDLSAVTYVAVLPYSWSLLFQQRFGARRSLVVYSIIVRSAAAS